MLIGKRELPELNRAGPPVDFDLDVARSCHIKLATPMFGGGAQAAVFDPRFPIRASGIRGQLRFWWRLLNAVRFPRLFDLQLRESEIFGGPDFPSPLCVRVEPQKTKPEGRSSDESFIDARGKKVARPFGFQQYGPECYALFAALNNTEHNTIELVKEGFSFQLLLNWSNPDRLNTMRARQNEERRRADLPKLADSIDDIGPEIEAALCAWVMWGGIGSRTRRGVGSLECPEIQQMAARSDLCLPPGARLFLYSSKEPSTALTAWNAAVGTYQRFRQSFRRLPGPNNRPGRSRWPEPDSIRSATGCGDPRHTPPMVSQTVPNFPKAALGLPIGFQFVVGATTGSASAGREPANVMLVPEDQERMASPIITKPVFIDDQWRSAVLILPYKHALEMDCTLRGVAGGARWNPVTRKAEDLSQSIPASQIAGSAMATLGGEDNPMHGHENAISALISFLGKPADGQGVAKPVFRERRSP